ncbi:ankyrin repeat and death domain-containing protein [Anaeramoeba flamelloides]|uniref:Ankyrin repeat and death domain-containing protein n=1 Tax=Anaeramoeba flamelloides TaxID=1746091 RepID=A0ABQ8YEW6_9EUKA|nr:ankyrin repeat and death domain-containing protein [Anaeramoeba flamelloides]
MSTEPDWGTVHINARDGDLESLKKNIEIKRLDPNTNKSDDWRPIHLAALNDNIECIEYLISQGADLNLRENKDRTPLHIAIHSSNQCIKNLLNHSKLPKLFQDLIKEDKEDLLLEYSIEELTNSVQFLQLTVIHLCCIYNRPKILKKVIEMGMNINCNSVYSHNGLHFCSIFNNTECLSILLENGIEVNASTVKNETALLLCCKYGYHENVKLLLEYNADPFKNNYVNLNAFHYAVFKDHYKCLELLLKIKNATSLFNSKSNNLVHFAVKACAVKSLPLLKRSGADLEILNKNKKSPFDVALKHALIPSLKWLLRQKNLTFLHKHNKKDSPIQSCVKKDQTELLDVLLSSGKFNVNGKDPNGNTGLHYSVIKPNDQCTRVLLRYGAKPTLVNNLGVSPYEEATEKNMNLIKNYKKIKPQKITFLQCIHQTATTLTLIWTIPKSYEKITQYRIKVNSENQKRLVNTQSINNWAVVNRLSPNTQYNVKIKAFNYFGSSKYSKSKTINTKPATVPATIHNLTQVLPLSKSQIHAKWNLPNNNGDPIKEYELRITDIDYAFKDTFFSNKKTPEFIITDLKQMTTYFLEVRCKNKFGWSNWSVDSLMRTK